MENLLNIDEKPTSDDLLNVHFYELIEDGVPVEYISISGAGDKTLEHHSILTDEYRARFARKYAAFKAMNGEGGTPIDSWEDAAASMRRELVYLGFHTVEQLAHAPDSSLARVMGGSTIRRRAQEFLARGKVSTADVIAKQQAEIDELKSALTELLAVKRGRPAREVEAA